MKKKVIIFVTAMLSACLLAGCQKSKDDSLNQEIGTSKINQTKVEAFNEYNEEKESKTKVSETKASKAKAGKINSSSANAVVSKSKISLDKKRIIKDQSFKVKLNDWGSVRFISYGPEAGADFEDVSFYLMKGNKVKYSFPYYCKNNRTDNYVGLFDSVASVGFRDLNNDNLNDVIVIINYITGAGPQGMVPRPRARIFLADKKEFHLAKDLIDEINDNIEEKDMSIDNICKYLKNK
ncbi:hypothetical protein [Anaerocolumna jejuensis]|uniref:hypothetical protein n=1 Tax=Anaerocolumna jejuensis TaxID=259063 RepID=UPI003F7C1A0A